MTALRRHAAAVLFALSAATSTVGCGGASSRASASTSALLPRFEDALDGSPDAVLVLKPQAIKRDPLYGPLWQRVMRAAMARGGSAVGSDRALQAVEGADSVVMAIGHMRGGDAIVGLRGVPAGLEPARLVDPRGRPMWQSVATNGTVDEYAPVEAAERSTLFVLPGREWVFVLGEGAPRARQGFARPQGKPLIEGDEPALVLFRMRGDSLLREVRSLKSGALAPIGARLVALTLAIPPGKEHAVVATLTYADDAAATAAEERVRAVLAVLAGVAASGSQATRFAWLRDAEVVRQGSAVRLRAALPPRLLEDLPNAGSAPIDL